MTLCKLLLSVATLALPLPLLAQYKFTEQWAYSCEGEVTSRCVKRVVSNMALQDGSQMPFNQCKLTCFTDGPVWPRPTGNCNFGKQVTRFALPGVFLDRTKVSDAVKVDIDANFEIFKEHLDMYHPDYNFMTGIGPWPSFNVDEIERHQLKVVVTVSNEDKYLTLLTDESYMLVVSSEGDITTAQIIATTFFGARHGFETLSQVINYDENNDCLQIISDVMIEQDSPVFPYRGLIIDTSRNYIPISDIQRTIEAMASNKLNTFHWHITDTNSIPLVFESLPQMTNYGAESGRQLYQPVEVRQLVEYGRLRGVRVLPEIDSPAHVGNGWQWGPEYNLGDLAVCVNKEPWASYCVQPPCGQLNIANENIYDVLGTLYEDLVSLFDHLDLYHFGGDEIHLNCWNSSSEIIEWMSTVGDGSLTEDAYYAQWSRFQEEAYKRFGAANGRLIPGIIWSSSLTEHGRADKYLDKDKYIIQIWTTGDDPIISELLEKGFRVIFSNHDAWYLDCGFGAWVGDGNNWCSPYKGWQLVYDNSPLSLAGSTDYKEQVLGGEAALWSEEVAGATMDAKLWPRGAALAERLWSNPGTGWTNAEPRMIHHRQRMTTRGVAAERLQPQWCYQNQGLCYSNTVEDHVTTSEVTTEDTTDTTPDSVADGVIPSFAVLMSVALYYVLYCYSR